MSCVQEFEDVGRARARINSSESVLYAVKGSSGNTIKVYSVPKSETSEFENDIENKKKKLVSSYGDQGISLVRIEKLF